MTGIRLHFRSHEISRDGVRVYLPPKTFRLCAVLVVAGGRLLNAAELVEAVYGDDPRGGPLWAYGAIGKRVFDLRELVAPIGIKLRNTNTLGWWLELEPISVAIAA